MTKKFPKGEKMLAGTRERIDIHNCHPQLKLLAAQAAQECGETLNEWAARTLAESLGRPEFGAVLRKNPGRPSNILAGVAAN